MKTKSLFCLGLAAILLAGCVVQCIYPLFTEKEFMQYPALVGTWTQKDEDKEVGLWTFTEDERRYKLSQTDEKGRKAVFQVVAGKIGTNVFLDCSLADPSPTEQLNDFATVHLVGAHTFVKAIKTNDALLLVAMNTEWLEKHLEQNPKAVAHIRRDKMPPLLTASTEELKKFVATFANDTNAFQNEIKLVPKKAAK
jgi:hypothetical protein